jgi:chromosome segregation ATPase
MRRLIALAALTFAALTTLAGDRFSYIYAQDDHGSTISRGHVQDIVRVAKRYSGTYIWLRRDGREYMIRDAATLAAARDAFADMQALEPQEREAERNVQVYEKKMEALEKKIDRISDQLGDDDEDTLSDATRNDLEDQLRDLERQMRGIEREMKPFERAQEDVEKEMERREKIAERRLEEIIARAIREGRAVRE